MNENVIIGIVSKHYPINKNRTDNFIRDEVKQAIFDNNAIAIGILSPKNQITFSDNHWIDNLSKYVIKTRKFRKIDVRDK